MPRLIQRFMIEIRNRYHTQKLFATALNRWDFLRMVYYGSYRGEAPIPFYFVKRRGTTAWVDLRKDLSEHFSSLKSNVRNEIRRAEREGCQVKYSQDYAAFVSFYNEFARKKKSLYPITVSQVEKYGNSVVSVVKHGERLLAMHVTAFDEDTKTAFLLYSCSARLEENAHRSLMGMANRYLHWCDFEHFQSMGYERFDWNGVSLDPADRERYRIGCFKLSLGGDVVERVNLFSPLFALMFYLKKILRSIFHG